MELKEMNCSNNIQMHFWLLQLSSQSTLLVHNSLKTHKSPQVIRLISLTRCWISTEQYASWSLLRESSKIFLYKARDCIRKCTFMLVENACCRFLLPDFRSQLQYVSCSLLIESSKIFLHKPRDCIRECTFMLVSECLFHISLTRFRISSSACFLLFDRIK